MIINQQQQGKGRRGVNPRRSPRAQAHQAASDHINIHRGLAEVSQYELFRGVRERDSAEFPYCCCSKSRRLAYIQQEGRALASYA